MRLAYLCNVYPAVSHSFIRREIEGLEGLGHQVHRFSIRPVGLVVDPADRREEGITEAVLGQGLIKLAATTVGLAVTRPAKALSALRTALRLSPPGLERKFRHLVYWLEAAWLVRRTDDLAIEHLHVHFGTNPTAVATIMRAWGGPPFSFTAHGPDEFDAPGPLALDRKIEAAHFVVAISSFGRAQLMRWSKPEQWPKIRVVRCGLDEAFLDAAPKPIPTESTEFICVARLSAQKGLPLLVAACDQLNREGHHFTLTIIGDGELRTMLATEIERRGLGGVITLAGSRSSADIRDALSGARAFVLPSFAEGLPVVIMEALALERPVITTAIAGIPELVDDQCGWLIPAGCVSELGDAMHAALEASPDSLVNMGAVGRSRVLEMHDARRNAVSLADAFLGNDQDKSIR